MVSLQQVKLSELQSSYNDVDNDVDNIDDASVSEGARDASSCASTSSLVWTDNESHLLCSVVDRRVSNHKRSWTAMQAHFPDRSTESLRARWRRVNAPQEMTRPPTFCSMCKSVRTNGHTCPQVQR